jgi:hypothetical protein
VEYLKPTEVPFSLNFPIRLKMKINTQLFFSE